jgi:hypothetical protein
VSMAASLIMRSGENVMGAITGVNERTYPRLWSPDEPWAAGDAAPPGSVRGAAPAEMRDADARHRRYQAGPLCKPDEIRSPTDRLALAERGLSLAHSLLTCEMLATQRDGLRIAVPLYRQDANSHPHSRRTLRLLTTLYRYPEVRGRRASQGPDDAEAPPRNKIRQTRTNNVHSA